MVGRAVVDSGPIIHLSEIGLFKALSLFDLLIPEAVYGEVDRKDAPGKKEISSYNKEKLSAGEKEFAALLVEKYEIGLGEAEAISIAKKRGIKLILVDDLDAREAARDLGLEPHGSVGILLRAFREKRLSRKETIDGLKSLVEDSTLFITRHLVEEAIKAVEKYEVP
jgi:hypothetical protein